MRCAVVIPPITDFYFTPHRAAALGAGIAAAEMQALGHQVEICNFPAQGKAAALPLPPPLQYLEPYILPDESGPTACFTHYKRFGPAPAACARAVRDAGPWDIIFISTFAFAYAEDAAACAAEMKRAHPSVPIAAAGAGVTAFPEWYLNAEGIDCVLPGEAEQTIPSSFSESGLDLGTYRSGSAECGSSAAVSMCTADRIRPFCAPARETKREIQFSASISRGCPKNCAFCPGKLSSGPGFRRPELSEALHAVISVIEAYAPDPEKQLVLNIEDDNILADLDFCFSFLGELRKQFPPMQFTAENGIDYFFLDDNILDRLIDAGFRQFNFSAGVMDSGASQQMQRAVSMNKLEELIRKAAARGVRTITYFIPGYAKDTPEKAVSALVRLTRLPGLIGISPFYAVPGLPGFQDKQQFLSLSPSLCKGSSFYPWNDALTSRQLITLFRLARLANSLRSANLLRMNRLQQEMLQSCLRDGKLYTINGQKGKGEKRTIIEIPGTDKIMVNQFFSQSFQNL